MLTDDPRLYSRLLSEKAALSVQEKESMLKAVLSRVDREEKPGRRRGIAAFYPVLKPALAVSVLLLVPLVFVLRGVGPDDDFLEKGPPSGVPLFSVKCIGDRRGDAPLCRIGDKLIFNVHPPAGKPYFAAFARRDSDDVVIWYFPELGKHSSIELSDAGNGSVLSKGIAIGREHSTGTYRVYGLFSSRPVSRNEIKSAFDERFKLTNGLFTVSSVRFEIK